MPSLENAIDRMIDIASGATDSPPDDIENRGTRRMPFEAPVAFVQWTPSGGKSIPTLVATKNISSSGMCVVSRYMLHVGHEGVVLIQRGSGEEVLLGVRVVHCEYVGEMQHESGLEFIAVPSNLSLEDFRDEHGNMPQLRPGKAA
jgi:hypothetical protein